MNSSPPQSPPTSRPKLPNPTSPRNRPSPNNFQIFLTKPLDCLSKRRHDSLGRDEMGRKQEKCDKMRRKCGKTGTKCSKTGPKWDSWSPIRCLEINTRKSVYPRFFRGFLIGMQPRLDNARKPLVVNDGRKARKMISLVPILESWGHTTSHGFCWGGEKASGTDILARCDR